MTASVRKGPQGCWQPTAAAREGMLRPCGACLAPRLWRTWTWNSLSPLNQPAAMLGTPAAFAQLSA